MNEKTISLITPVWIIDQELLELTKATVDSLAETEGDILETIFVDDGSTIGTDYLRAVANIYVSFNKNRGYPYAMTRGIKVASGDLLAIGNNDIRVSPNWLRVAREILADPKNNKVASVHFRMLNYNDPMVFGDDVWTEGKERWCSSSFYVIRREALPEGLYDVGYGPGGFDDYDWWHRIRDINNWKTAYTNRACYQHKHTSTQNKRDRKQWLEQMAKNREYYKSKFGEYPDDQFARLFPEQMRENWVPFP